MEGRYSARGRRAKFVAGAFGSRGERGAGLVLGQEGDGGAHDRGGRRGVAMVVAAGGWCGNMRVCLR